LGPPPDETAPPALTDDLRRIAEAARPHYERLVAFRL
jgi:hypothetical protein